MTGNGLGRLSVALGAILALTACQTGQPFGFLKKKGDLAEPVMESADASASAASGPAPLIEVIGGGERDVESPETFQLSDQGLWDGRPSLGGVWVAHTSVKDPERVVIRNAANGKSVIGALFRREIDNPGPSLQLSSDAAEALGMLAGQPAAINVVALRRIEAPVAPVVAATDVAAVTTAADAPGKKPKKGDKTKAIDTTTLDPVAVTAAAAIDKAAADKTASKKPKANATTPAPETAAPAAAGAMSRSYVQIGIFSVEANAKKAAKQMEKAGMAAAVKPDTSQGKTFWRVIVGPAATLAERDAFAAKVKGLGYPDAYPVSK